MKRMKNIKIDINGAPKTPLFAMNFLWGHGRLYRTEFSPPVGVIKFTFHRSNSKNDNVNEEGTQTVSREVLTETNCYDFPAMMRLNDFHHSHTKEICHVLQHYQNNVVMHKLRKLLYPVYFIRKG